VKQPAHGTSQVASSILDVNREALKTGSASGGVHSSARVLAAESSKLRLDANKLPASVRASWSSFDSALVVASHVSLVARPNDIELFYGPLFGRHLQRHPHASDLYLFTRVQARDYLW
jgi:hypothetical protein